MAFLEQAPRDPGERTLGFFLLSCPLPGRGAQRGSLRKSRSTRMGGGGQEGCSGASELCTRRCPAYRRPWGTGGPTFQGSDCKVRRLLPSVSLLSNTHPSSRNTATEEIPGPGQGSILNRVWGARASADSQGKKGTGSRTGPVAIVPKAETSSPSSPPLAHSE